MKKIRWGIIATGAIASKFAQACRFECDRSGISELYAVASRDEVKSLNFANTWNIPVSYASYEELLADPEVDVVYIATPHSMHAPLSYSALQSGKAVLCEKPVSLQRDELEPVIALARQKKLFFMEAMWMKFNPSFQTALKWALSGKIGFLRYIRSDFCFSAQFNPVDRLFDPALGGGALLDVGIYPVTLAHMFSGGKKPSSISAIMRNGPTGVDIWNKAVLSWDSGVFADLSSSISIHGGAALRSALIVGEQGSILLPDFWMAQRAVLLNTEGLELAVAEAPFECNGYEYEIREVEHCLLGGKIESSVQTWSDSIMVMEILDQIRKVAAT